MTLTKKQIISVIMLLALVFSLPVAIYLTRKMQDVRPRALQGKANFLLSTDSITSTVGENIDVLVTLQLTDPVLRVSGVDFLLLYDKNRLDVGNIVPNVIAVDPKAPFTDAPIVTSGGSFDENFNFVRVTVIARRPDIDLPKGTFQLAKITFRGRGTGSATIKFPDDNKYLEIVGTGTYVGPTAVPTSVPVAVNLSLVPASSVVPLNSAQTFTLQATFPSGSVGQKLDFFTAEIDFPKDILMMQGGQYIDTSASGFKKIVRVDGPTQANGSGKIMIALGADVPGGGPATNNPITIATIKLQGKTLSSSAQNISFGNTQIVNSSSQALTVSTAGTTFTVQ